MISIEPWGNDTFADHELVNTFLYNPNASQGSWMGLGPLVESYLCQAVFSTDIPVPLMPLDSTGGVQD